MLRFLFTALTLFLFQFILSAQTTQHVNADEFHQLITSQQGVILDVRTPQEFSRGHIIGATLISVSDNEFVSKINLLQKDNPVYLYCLTGSRSRAAANYLSKQGFSKVYNLQRGIMEWNQKGFAIEKTAAVIASKSTTYTPQDFQQLIQSEKLVLIDFHAQWCAPCKKMNPVVDKISTQYQGKVKIEKVDVEANKTITEAYKVQSIPGFVLFKKGLKVWSHSGMLTHEELAGILNKFL